MDDLFQFAGWCLLGLSVVLLYGIYFLFGYFESRGRHTSGGVVSPIAGELDRLMAERIYQTGGIVPITRPADSVPNLAIAELAFDENTSNDVVRLAGGGIWFSTSAFTTDPFGRSSAAFSGEGLERVNSSTVLEVAPKQGSDGKIEPKPSCISAFRIVRNEEPTAVEGYTTTETAIQLRGIDMSHQTIINGIEIKDLNALDAAVDMLQRSGMRIKMLRNAKSRVYGGQSSEVFERVIHLEDASYDIAVIPSDNGGYVLQTDFFGGSVPKVLGVAPMATNQDRLGRLYQQYTIQSIIRQADQAGKSVLGTTVREDGSIVVQVGV